MVKFIQSSLVIVAYYDYVIWFGPEVVDIRFDYICDMMSSSSLGGG